MCSLTEGTFLIRPTVPFKWDLLRMSDINWLLPVLIKRIVCRFAIVDGFPLTWQRWWDVRVRVIQFSRVRIQSRYQIHLRSRPITHACERALTLIPSKCNANANTDEHYKHRRVHPLTRSMELNLQERDVQPRHISLHFRKRRARYRGYAILNVEFTFSFIVPYYTY